MVGRLSTNMIFSILSQQVSDSQKAIMDLSKKIN